MTAPKKSGSLSKFDKAITHKFWGKILVVLIILGGLLLSFIPALPLMGLGQAIGKIPDPAYNALIGIGCPMFIASLLCDILLRSISFAGENGGISVKDRNAFGGMQIIIQEGKERRIK